MRFLIPAILMLITPLMALAESSFPSPDGTYDVKIEEDEFRVRNLTVVRGDKQLFSTSSGYGGYTAVSWSPDSRYLAVVEHGTKTTMNLAVYRLDADSVRSVTLPDFRLNILGRFNKIEGGRYQFDEALSWKKGPALQFVALGSLVDGASNPDDHPDNWYRFKVMIGFTSDRASLLVVTPAKQDEQAGTGQPATRPESKPEGGDKPQPESEGRSR